MSLWSTIYKPCNYYHFFLIFFMNILLHCNNCSPSFPPLSPLSFPLTQGQARGLHQYWLFQVFPLIHKELIWRGDPLAPAQVLLSHGPSYWWQDYGTANGEKKCKNKSCCVLAVYKRNYCWNFAIRLYKYKIPEIIQTPNSGVFFFFLTYGEKAAVGCGNTTLSLQGQTFFSHVNTMRAELSRNTAAMTKQIKKE